MASYCLPLLAINYHHHHRIAAALLHARWDACCVLLNPISSLPPRSVQVSEPSTILRRTQRDACLLACDQLASCPSRDLLLLLRPRPRRQADSRAVILNHFSFPAFALRARKYNTHHGRRRLPQLRQRLHWSHCLDHELGILESRITTRYRAYEASGNAARSRRER